MEDQSLHAIRDHSMSPAATSSVPAVIQFSLTRWHQLVKLIGGFPSSATHRSFSLGVPAVDHNLALTILRRRSTDLPPYCVNWHAAYPFLLTLAVDRVLPESEASNYDFSLHSWRRSTSLS